MTGGFEGTGSVHPILSSLPVFLSRSVQSRFARVLSRGPGLPRRQAAARNDVGWRGGLWRRLKSGSRRRRVERRLAMAGEEAARGGGLIGGSRRLDSRLAAAAWAWAWVRLSGVRGHLRGGGWASRCCSFHRTWHDVGRNKKGQPEGWPLLEAGELTGG